MSSSQFQPNITPRKTAAPDVVESPCTCRACDHPIKSQRKGFVNGFVNGTRFEWVICQNCGTMLTGIGEIAILNDLYNAIYRNSKMISGYRRYHLYGTLSEKEIVQNLFDIFYSEKIYFGAYTLIRDLSKISKKKLRILEVGSGLGYTTARLRKLGHDVIGCDLSRDACARATEIHGGEFICGSTKDVFSRYGNDFDAVILLEVIEHVDNPYKMLSDFKLLLNSTGVIIVTTPNLGMRTKWQTTEPPIHVSFFSVNGIKSLIQRLHGFGKIIEFSQDQLGTKNFDTAESLPGHVLLADLTPNTNYFDNRTTSHLDLVKVILRNQLNKIRYNFFDRARIKPISDFQTNLSSDTIIVRIEFPEIR